MTDQELSRKDLAIWHAFKQMGVVVMTEVERDLAEMADLTGSDYGVLSRLVDLGDGELRQQMLANSMGWHKSRLSHQLTRMQERGLVRRRETAPRVVTVSITPFGRQKIDAARPIHAASVRRWLLTRLSCEEADALLKLSAKLTANQR
ncbi:MarR family transcriptional regulator [Rhizobium sp. P38BS-XIX]|uniref:MarR family winged helix-turn-helix transcriptional regulator n=1 Tax=Rhizobium sp. P38BS-XIX TaxID=2726740 RepID=UPI0014569716|nr:MarR family transcriptional regulator [Rhizobium sp. P38BS-XIX]NLR97783.1 MarR family transcriptional regulator [Rhizobium sp. P38BS-XIX]